MPTQLNLFSSRIGPEKNFFVHTARSTSGSHNAVSNLSYTNLTTKTSKDVKEFVAMEQTCIQYTPPDIHCTNLGINNSNFYLNTPMPNPKYMRFHLDITPYKIIVHYNLNIVTPDGWVYIEIWNGMYGLPQASILANWLLKKRLVIKGYYQYQHTPGLWRHVWKNIMFCLVVDDFGIKVTNMHDMLDHLVNTLKEHYTIAIDMMGSLFCGIYLTWNYTLGHIDCHMPGYINKALTKYQHPKPVSP
jgi:hypothetical protein